MFQMRVALATILILLFIDDGLSESRTSLSLGESARGHDMMHRSVLIIYDQQFMIATITTDHA